ncbi:MAG: DUF4097 family beta strand repeat-containing protein [Balneolaceae bacterium]
MKTLSLCILLFSIGLSQAQAPNSSNQIQETVQLIFPASEFNANTIFSMKNINGDVRVTGYKGDEILITGTKTVWKKRGDIEESEAEKVYLAKYQFQNKIYAYIQAPGVEMREKHGDLRFNWNSNGRDKNRVQFEFNLELQVPFYLMSKISTINGGEVLVRNMRNGVSANNVNGNIILQEISGETHANTVNGDISVLFAENPETDASFKTVNGEIEIEALQNLSAIVTFQSLHGDLYTDFENIHHLPNRIKQTSDEGSKKFKVEQTSPIKIGDGGPIISFQIVNGSAFIKQRKL